MLKDEGRRMRYEGGELRYEGGELRYRYEGGGVRQVGYGRRG